MAVVTREQRELSCLLTNEELADASNLLASKTMELVELEDRKSVVAKEYKAKIDAMAAANAVTARKINSKSELRQVTCEWAFYWETGKKTLYRTDTDEKIVEDFIKDFESQRHFEDLQKEQEAKAGESELPTGAPPKMPDPGPPQLMEPQKMIDGTCTEIPPDATGPENG